MIELLTAATPNGWKILIALKEMELEHTVRPIDLSANEQKEDWFLKLNPNGRIPAIIDHGNDDFVVFESGAILMYLAERTGKFLPKEEKARSEVIQWLMWQMGGLGPMMGQANVFFRYAPEKIPFAIDRYHREGKRLLSVIDERLEGRDYLCGEYSIADMASWPWARGHEWSGIDISDLPRLKAWIERIRERPAIKEAAAEAESRSKSAEATKKVVEGVRKFLS